jgi:uncharacterized membrane protein
MTMSNAITGRATRGPMEPGPLATHVRSHRHPREDLDHSRQGLAQGLGWFSVGLGLAQVLAPREFARFIGVQDDARNCALLRLVGLRELACGAGLFSVRRPAGWAWARVAGDMMDLALLGSALVSGATRRDRVTAATAAVIGATVADLYGAVRLGEQADGQGLARGWGLGEVQVQKAITVNRPLEEVYRFWRDFRNLPRFMNHLQSVELVDDRCSHWKTKGPAGMSVEWDAEIVGDRPNEAIAWRSVEGSQVDHEGSVRFVPAPGGRGTEVHVTLRYTPPGGAVGAAIAWLFGESADQQIYDDLRAFKQVIEIGEVTVSDGTLGRRGYWQRPAQPPVDWPGLED